MASYLSMPMPQPPVGGSPYSRAVQKFSSRNMASYLSMPMPQPPVGGSPYSRAVQKFSSRNMASSSPLALSFACCSNLKTKMIKNIYFFKFGMQGANIK
jgi:hypothetical protein